MRWDDLFADLQSQWEVQAREEDDAQIFELAQAEAAGVALHDRVRARRGQSLHVRLLDGGVRSGVLADVGDRWLLLVDGQRRHLVPSSALVAVWPLAGAAPPSGAVERGLTLGRVLRGLGQEQLPVRLRLHGSDLTGAIVRVGRDHVDVLSDGAVLSIPWTALLTVSSL